MADLMNDVEQNTTSVSTGTDEDPDLDANIQDTDAKFKKACQQLILLNNYIEAIQVRYDRANKNSNRTARYNYRIKLCVVEGVRNMFYEYAVRLADQIDDMRRQSGMIVVREDSDEAMDEDEDEAEDEWEDGYHSDEVEDDEADMEDQQQATGPAGLSSDPCSDVAGHQ